MLVLLDLVGMQYPITSLIILYLINFRFQNTDSATDDRPGRIGPKLVVFDALTGTQFVLNLKLVKPTTCGKWELC